MKAIIFFILLASFSFSSTVDEFLESLKTEILKENPNFSGFNEKRGKEIFLSKHIGKKGELISCASCHGENLYKSNPNFFTTKTIEALSPKANKERFTKISTIKKWLKRNFNDVYKREGTALEKGDVVTYIINQ